MRKARGLSQRALGPLLHVSHATISKWEMGKAAIDADLLPRIAATLGQHPCDFFDERPLDVRRTGTVRATAAAEGVEEDRLHIDYFREQMGLDDEAAIELRKLAELLQRRRPDEES